MPTYDGGSSSVSSGSLVNVYSTAAELGVYMQMTVAGGSDLETRCIDALNAASRMIDRHCRRRFYSDDTATVRRFRPETSRHCPVDDISVDTDLVVAVDLADDGTFTAWDSSVYELFPYNPVVEGEDWPYTEIHAIDDLFPTLHRRPAVQVTARWGWPQVPEPVRQACLLLGARLLRRSDSPEGVAGFGDFGPVRVSSKMDADAAELLRPYCKVGVLR